MKKLFYLAALFLTGCSSCDHANTTVLSQPTVSYSSCSEESCPAPDISGNVPINTSVNEDDYHFVLPGNDWVSQSLPDNKGIHADFYSPSKNVKVLLGEIATSDTFSEFVIKVIRSQSGDILISENMEINGNKFVLLQTVVDKSMVWMWVTVKNGFGYILTCGSEKIKGTDLSLKDFCGNISDTIRIK